MGINGVRRGPGGGKGAMGGGFGNRRGQGPRDGAGFRGGQGTCQLGEISEATAADLIFMKQEEKMARDVYQVLYEKWGHATFRNIGAAEQRHLDAVTRLITRSDLADPTPVEPGKFANPEIQSFYDKSVATGMESLAKALAVGVMIEEADIACLEAMLAGELDLPVKRVLTNLLAASRNHLAAFNSALAAVDSAPASRPGRAGRR